MLYVYFAVKATKRNAIDGPTEIQNSSINWLFFGLFASLGLMNKHSMFFFGFSLIIGFLFTKDRKIFLDKIFSMTLDKS